MKALRSAQQDLVKFRVYQPSESVILAAFKDRDSYVRSKAAIMYRHLLREGIDVSWADANLKSLLLDPSGDARREAIITIVEFEGLAKITVKEIIDLVISFPNTDASWFAVEAFTPDGLLYSERKKLLDRVSSHPELNLGREVTKILHRVESKF